MDGGIRAIYSELDRRMFALGIKRFQRCLVLLEKIKQGHKISCGFHLFTIFWFI